MNKFILDMLIKRITDKKTKLLISSLSYYAILALIPTLLLTTLILKTFDIPIYIKYQNFFDIISINLFSSFFITIVTIYMISRIFFLILKDQFSPLKSIIFSIGFSFLLILFFASFLTSYTITNSIVSNLVRIMLIIGFFLTISFFSSQSSFKYSLIFSIVYSLISNLFIQVFFYAASFFINYEKYYGILAPIFLMILAIHIFIYITCIAYIGAEEFTKISKIKFIKC